MFQARTFAGLSAFDLLRFGEAPIISADNQSSADVVDNERNAPDLLCRCFLLALRNATEAVVFQEMLNFEFGSAR